MIDLGFCFREKVSGIDCMSEPGAERIVTRPMFGVDLFG